MNQINLLPWREQVRKKLTLQFFSWLVLYGIFGLVALAMLHFYFSQILKTAVARKTFLESASNEEQAILFSLSKKMKEQTALKGKLNFIISIRQNNNQVIQLFNDLVRIVPEGVSLTKITKQGNQLVISGKSQSNLQVTNFMEKISHSQNFKQPELTNLNENKMDEVKDFQISVKLTSLA